jgi:hypothetical protein
MTGSGSGRKESSSPSSFAFHLVLFSIVVISEISRSVQTAESKPFSCLGGYLVWCHVPPMVYGLLVPPMAWCHLWFGATYGLVPQASLAASLAASLGASLGASLTRVCR